MRAHVSVCVLRVRVLRMRVHVCAVCACVCVRVCVHVCARTHLPNKAHCFQSHFSITAIQSPHCFQTDSLNPKHKESIHYFKKSNETHIP